MANKKSAQKMILKISKRTKINRAHKNKCKTYIKKVEQAVSNGDKSIALTNFYACEKVLQKTVGKGILHIKTVSRKLSRLSRNIKNMPGEFVLPNKKTTT